jgi:hypothetical protein
VGTADCSAALRNDKQEEQANANADPPFDFAQGRLYGDDNQKNKGTTRKTEAEVKSGEGDGLLSAWFPLEDEL